MRNQRWTVAALLLLSAVLLSPAPRHASAGCNLIPAAERIYPSTLGSVSSPIAAPGDTVEIRLSACDGSPGFATPAGANTVAVTFQPPGAGADTLVPVTNGVVVADCDAGVCATLRFPMPDTASDYPPDGLAGPATITVDNTLAAQRAATIDALFEPHALGSTCDKQPETVFQQLTVLPALNVFAVLAGGSPPPILATTDGSGALLVPFDHTAILPLGPAAPVARLASITATLDAFTSNPGVPIAIPSSGFVRSFTPNGRPLPPLLRATSAGSEIFGATDAVASVIRVARTDGGPPIFDLTDRYSNAGRGPIVINTFTATTEVPIPLAALRSTAGGIAFGRDEALEGDLNADLDPDDQVIEIVNAATFQTTNTGLAATLTSNPVTARVALDVGTDKVAFLESEAAQGETDFNLDGDALDDRLRVFDFDGNDLAPPSPGDGGAGHYIDPFPAIDDKPVAISGDNVFYRISATDTAGVALAGPGGAGVIAGGTFMFNGGVAVSPDGRVVFDAAVDDVSSFPSAGFLRMMGRDAVSGLVVSGLKVLADEADASGLALAGANGIAVAPTGQFVYVAAAVDSGVQVIKVVYGGDPPLFPPSHGGGNADLIPVQAVFDGIGGVDGLGGATHLALAPDGTTLYASGTAVDALAVFAVDATTGALTFVESQHEGVAGVIGLDEPRALAVSPDGKQLYVACHGSSSILAFDRNPITGALSFLAGYPDGGSGGPSLAGVRDVAVAFDGANLYAASEADSAVTVFARNGFTGALSFVESKIDGVAGVDGLSAVSALAVSGDGQRLYAASGPPDQGFAVFERRAAAGGTLAFIEAEKRGVAGVGGYYDDLDAPESVAVAPDGEHIYVAGRQTFQRLATLVAKDVTLPGGPVTTIGIASQVATADGEAVFLSPEGNGGGIDANGNGIANDSRVMFYSGGTTHVIGGTPARVADAVALSKTLVAITLPEVANWPLDPQSNDNDIDGDGSGESLVSVLPRGPGFLTDAFQIVPLPVLGRIAVTDQCEGGTHHRRACSSDVDCPSGACRGTVVAIVNALSDSTKKPPPFDLRCDAECPGCKIFRRTVANLPIAAYHSGSGEVVALGKIAQDFSVSGTLVAYRASEPYCFADLNGDGDQSDLVMQVYDLERDLGINTRQAVYKCELPGCEPGLPYKIVNGTVSFLTREQDQGGIDLDGNGSVTDTVVQIFNPRSYNTQVLATAADAPTMPPLPTSFVGGSILYQEQHESDLGVDVNDDGDMDDLVTLVQGDADGDGNFDDHDTCTETANLQQRDSDLDGLGDACDPNAFCNLFVPASPPVLGGTTTCGAGVAKALRAFLKTRFGAVQKCLDRIVKGKLVGESTTLCRGGTNGEVDLPPADRKTKLAIVKAAAKLRRTVDKVCPFAELAAMEACGADQTKVAVCTAGRAGATAVTAAFAGYGEVAAIGDTALKKCQTGVGKATAGYVKSIVAAMHGCLDRRNAGELVGDGQALCLGSSTPSGLVLPTDPDTNAAFDDAAAKLFAKIDGACPSGIVAGLDACGDDAAAAAECLACAAWRAGVETARSVYGPQ